MTEGKCKEEKKTTRQGGDGSIEKESRERWADMEDDVNFVDGPVEATRRAAPAPREPDQGRPQPSGWGNHGPRPVLDARAIRPPVVAGPRSPSKETAGGGWCLG